ncbi:MAG: DNA mismatch repair endonuclease MutL [Blautia sp.]|nr:DNA mismatch repair endonuclease MutL [Blautia sp.]
MSSINMLSQETIDKIAAGEVVERPRSVVKELVENAIDAGATAITVEIKEGGLSFIRITDNGSGIAKEEVALAFLRHSTSKIKSAEDLLDVRSLGFRGEALSSIAAVSRVELITKTGHALTGTRYLIEGSKELSLEDVGAPDGTTFLVKDLFYNTPARRKFLKTPQTEGTYISDLIEKLALSHPEISFKFINNNQTKLHTSGNGNRRDLIYHIYGRDITAELLPVDYRGEYFQLSGFIGKPSVNRGNRNFENYFINGRYIKSNLLSRAIEEAYKSFLMQHQYPFTVLYFDFTGETLDVNVHPTKMELRFGHNQEIYQELVDALYAVLSHRELIPEVPVTEEKPKAKIVHEYREPIPEPFEKRRLNDLRQFSQREEKQGRDMSVQEERGGYHAGRPQVHILGVDRPSAAPVQENMPGQEARENVPGQVTLESVAPDFLTEAARKKHRIIGQLFQTYWLLEYEDKLYIIDQHAAHEKVLYERTMKTLKDKEFTSQAISPPIVLSLDAKEQESLENCRSQLERLGYAVESFGGREYMISAVPANLFSIDVKDLFIEMLDDFSSLSGRQTPELILEKVASMSCKAAVKGNNTLSLAEIDALMGELLTLENPFNCPHGRPTIISMSKYEIEKKFKRIV